MNVAYHEAGHAAMLWMFGNWADLDSIDMRGKRGVWASVRSRGMEVAGLVGGLDRKDHLTAQFAKWKAQQSIMFKLAGYAAENRADGNANPGWFAELLDWPDEWQWSEAHDLSQAVSVAKALYGDTGRAWQFLRRTAAWTDEALTHQRLWAVVDALAKRLQTVKTRLSGQRAIAVMERAWGELDSPGPAFLNMGRIWRRRFPVKAGDNHGAKKGR